MRILLLITLIVGSLSLPNDLAISPISKGGYVRSYQLPDSTLLSCNKDNNQYINIYKKNENNNTWSLLSKVQNPSYPNVTNTDFANCFLFSSTNINNKVLIAARYHTNCQESGTHCLYYSIRVWISDNLGKTWDGGNTNGYIVDQVSYPTQETSNCGLWEPFIYEIKTPSNQINLNIYYAKEYLNKDGKKKQNITQQTSITMGKTWGNMIIASGSGSRDGMPSVTQFIDGTVIVSMENPWPINDGHFTLQTIKSYDGGLTYPESSRQIIFDPDGNNGWQSSASGIGYSNKSGKIIITSILDDGLHGNDTQQYIQYSDSVDGYNWNSFTIVNTKNAFWPNVYLYNEELYIEFNSDGVAYTTTYPVDTVPQQYVAFEYGINRNDSDIGGDYSPMKGVDTEYECYKECLKLDDEECMTFNWNKGKNCWLKNGDGNAIVSGSFDDDPNMLSNVLSSRWYYGSNTGGNIYKVLSGIGTKDECLFECLSVGINDCKHLIYNDGDHKCYLKSSIASNFSVVSWNTWLWIVPELTSLNRGTFVSETNGDIMEVDKDGMQIYNHKNNKLIADVPRYLVYNGNFTWNFEWGLTKMMYIADDDRWMEQGGAVWIRNGTTNSNHDS